MNPLSYEKRQLENAPAPTCVYRVESRDGTRTFKLPVIERRHAACELRAEDNDSGGIFIRGHAAVFGRRSDDLGGFREIINPGAFKTVLDGDPDVRMLFNHDPSMILARTRNKTLDLREDQRGLHYYGEAADTQYARDLRALIKRGDVDQSSFAFMMGPESRERWEESEDGEIVRTIIEVDGLFDVSPVTFPAYPQTDVSARELAPQTDEEEPAAAVASDDAAAEHERAQMAARLSELQAGARRRLAIAKARSPLA